MENIYELVRENETNYNSGDTTISKYVNFDLAETLNTIDAYLNSKHISGDKDSMDRDKPFMNICVSNANIWYRATDLDRKNIKIRATKTRDIFLDFMATTHLQNWMRKNNFGMFLNEWGMTLARYGSAVCKFIENKDGLHSEVIPFNRLIIDAIDMDNDVVIEVLELTPAQLKKREGYDQEIVEKLIETAVARETLNKDKKDTKANFIKIYEVHGELPLSYLTGKEKDKYEYVQQMHVVSFIAGKELGKFDDFTLYSGKEEKNPYIMTHLIKEDGRSIGQGAVERLFQSQWMVNHTAKQIKDQLDLASKLIYQTSDGNFIGQNALNAIETGDILIHAVNQPLTQLNNTSHDITSLQNYGNQWKAIGNELTGVSEAMLGVAPKSGTAWRQTEALLQENHDLFELMTENKGLELEKMMRKYVLPYSRKKLNNSDEVTATLEAHDIEKIDKKYIPIEAEKRLAKKLIKQIIETGEIPEVNQEMKDNEMQGVVGELDEQGSQRFFKPDEFSDMTWKELFKDMEWELEIDVTGEQKDNQSDMATLSTMFQVAVSNPQALQDPYTKWIFNKILLKTGTASPMEIAERQSVVPQGGQRVGADMSKLLEQPK